MSDALLGPQPMVAEWDGAAGLYLVREWVAGPAGTAGLRLAGGVEVDFDVAWPSRLAELRIPSTDGRLDHRTATVVERLLGPHRLSHMLQMDRDTPHQLDDESSMSTIDTRDAPLALPLGALARQIGDDPSESAVRRAAALLEASLWLQRDGDDLGARPTSSDAFRRGAEWLLSSHGALLPRDDTVRRELALLVRRTVVAHPDDSALGRRLQTLIDTLRPSTQGDLRPLVAASAAPVMAARSDFATDARREWQEGYRVPVDRRTLPSSLDDADIRAHRLTTAEIEVRVAGATDLVSGCWARAFDGDGTLVAMAPLRRIDGDAGALLLVAPDIVYDLVIDVTDLPAVRRTSSVCAHVEAASAYGRTAASAERAGRVKDAAIAWRTSAALWRDVDDDTRASTAERYASGTFTRRRSGGATARIPPALTADLLDAAVRPPDPDWA